MQPTFSLSCAGREYHLLTVVLSVAFFCVKPLFSVNSMQTVCWKVVNYNGLRVCCTILLSNGCARPYIGSILPCFRMQSFSNGSLLTHNPSPAVHFTMATMGQQGIVTGFSVKIQPLAVSQVFQCLQLYFKLKALVTPLQRLNNTHTFKESLCVIY